MATEAICRLSARVLHLVVAVVGLACSTAAGCGSKDQGTLLEPDIARLLASAEQGAADEPQGSADTSRYPLLARRPWHGTVRAHEISNDGDKKVDRYSLVEISAFDPGGCSCGETDGRVLEIRPAAGQTVGQFRCVATPSEIGPRRLGDNDYVDFGGYDLGVPVVPKEVHAIDTGVADMGMLQVTETNWLAQFVEHPNMTVRLRTTGQTFDATYIALSRKQGDVSPFPQYAVLYSDGSVRLITLAPVPEGQQRRYDVDYTATLIVGPQAELTLPSGEDRHHARITRVEVEFVASAAILHVTYAAGGTADIAIRPGVDATVMDVYPNYSQDNGIATVTSQNLGVAQDNRSDVTTTRWVDTTTRAIRSTPVSSFDHAETDQFSLLSLAQAKRNYNRCNFTYLVGSAIHEATFGPLTLVEGETGQRGINPVHGRSTASVRLPGDCKEAVWLHRGASAEYGVTLNEDGSYLVGLRYFRGAFGTTRLTALVDGQPIAFQLDSTVPPGAPACEGWNNPSYAEATRLVRLAAGPHTIRFLSPAQEPDGAEIDVFTMQDVSYVSLDPLRRPMLLTESH